MVSPEENEIALLLNQHAAFHGTKQFNHNHLAIHLNQLGLDIEADPFIQTSENEASLQFSLSDQSPEKLKFLLQILHQITFEPTLTNEEIEIARNHLLNKFEEEGKDPSQLQSVLAVDLRQFREKWYLPEKMSLTIVGLLNPIEMSFVIEQVFSSTIAFQEEISLINPSLDDEEDIQKNLLTSVNKRIELASDNQNWIVDGKIWMKEPHWIDTKSCGKTIGTILTVLGVAGMVWAFPIVAPAAIIAGSLGTATRIYFLTCDYFKDPVYTGSTGK